MDLWAILTFLLLIYIVVSALFIILENRQPASTISWLLLFVMLPVIGVLLYIFFGREQTPLAERRKLVHQSLGDNYPAVFVPLLAQQEQNLQAIKACPQRSMAQKRLAELLLRTKLSLLTVHNRLEILQDAQEKYPRLLEDIRQAQHSIHLQYFIWQADTYMQDFSAVLMEKAKQGIQVRILYDALGSVALDWKHKAYLHEMRQAGVEIYPYLNFRSLLKLHTLNYRNHRKIAVIDGKIGYTGGLNMGEEHLNGAGSYTAWRDTHVRITGEAVAVLQGIFITSWYNTTKESLPDAAYFTTEVDPAAYLPLQFVGSGPDTQWKAIQQLLFFSILAAEKHVYMQSPFFIPDTGIAEALKVAALSGVDVKLMCAPRDTENQLANWAANTYFLEMTRAGVKVYFYQPAYLHAKTMCIDTSVCSIGTANMDLRSLTTNYELNTVIYDEALTAELERDFAHDLEGCSEFLAEEYRQRTLLLRLRDSLARLMSPLL